MNVSSKDPFIWGDEMDGKFQSVLILLLLSKIGKLVWHHLS